MAHIFSVILVCKVTAINRVIPRENKPHKLVRMEGKIYNLQLQLSFF